MSRIVDTESTINFDDGTYDFTGGNTAWAGFVPNGQQFGETPVPDGSDDLLLTPGRRRNHNQRKRECGWCQRR